MNLEVFRDTASLWMVRRASAEDVVRVACDLLVAGVDGPAMCELAAVSIRHADADLPLVLEPALREVGLPHHEPGSTGAQEAGLVVMCARVLANEVHPQSLTSWAHAEFGHGGIDLAQGLVTLDDSYDMADVTGADTGELDAEVRAEALRVATAVR